MGFLFSFNFNFTHLSITGMNMCEKIPLECFENGVSGYTRKCLADLATHVVDSTEIKLAEKKLWLKKLKKCHNEVYEFCHFTE